MEAKGNALIKNAFKHTKNWPNPQTNFITGEVIDLEAEYKKGLAGRLCLVLDIAVDGNSYLVLGQSEKVGDFLWLVEKEDIAQFLPIIKKNGVVMPAGMSPIEEFAWLAKYHTNN